MAPSTAGAAATYSQVARVVAAAEEDTEDGAPPTQEPTLYNVEDVMKRIDGRRHRGRSKALGKAALAARKLWAENEADIRFDKHEELLRSFCAEVRARFGYKGVGDALGAGALVRAWIDGGV
jgi:hypothetical protein